MREPTTGRNLRRGGGRSRRRGRLGCLKEAQPETATGTPDSSGSGPRDISLCRLNMNPGAPADGPFAMRGSVELGPAWRSWLLHSCAVGGLAHPLFMAERKISEVLAKPDVALE